jgi:simple sugar transport system substrate-binding protein
MLRKRLLWPALAIVLVLLAAGCGSNNNNSSTASGASKSTGFKFAVVTHGQASDPFWSVVKNGVDQAAKDEGVTVNYQAPSTFDMVAMSRLIDAAVASKPDGLVVSIPDANALGPSIKKAVDAGIPVVSINSGSDVYKSLGVLTHVGQTEYEAGFQGGERMGAAGVKNALCVNQEVGNAALDLRCKGFTDAMKKTGGAVKVLAVNLADPTDTKNRIEAAIRSAGNIDGILALGPTGSTPALQVLQSNNQLDKIKLATFDLSPEVLEAVRDGKMLFAIDQQQYIQGYLPIVFLTLYKKYGTIPGTGGVITTGPAFVTKDNAAQVIDLSKKGIR